MAARTQQERRETTRRVLVDAALALLEERGWAATTAVAVCERAGLTRGALVHHFGDLPALLADALDTHHATLVASLADQAAPETLPELIESTWRVIDHGRFKIVIEAWLAMANDPDLAVAIAPVVERFAKLVHPSGLALLDDADHRTLFLTARESMLGLALGRATTGAPLPHEDAVIARLVHLATAATTDHDPRRNQR